MKKSFLLALSFCIYAIANAQQLRPLNSVQIFEQLQQLSKVTSVMYLAAHPDDENTRLLSYLVHHDHVPTVYFSVTRGDGGQNLIGNEQGAALGLIRNYELLAARNIDGATQAFSSFVDFGFTKSPEETFKFWDRRELVDEVKRAYQIYQPDVVICRFPTTGEGGHGQHTASAIVAKQAYDELEQEAKTNKNIFVPKRILFNAFSFGSRSTLKDDQFKLPTNQYNSLLGVSYGEMAGTSRSIHRSQGAGTPQSFGIKDEQFALMGGSPIEGSLYSGIETGYARLGAAQIDAMIAKAMAAYDFSRPEESISSFIEIKKELSKLKDGFYKAKKLKTIDQIILSSAGIMAEMITDNPQQVAGTSIPLTLNIIARSAHTPVTINKVYLATADKMPNIIQVPTRLDNDSAFQYKFDYKLPAASRITQPYWLSQPAKNSKYIYDPQYFSEPQSPDELLATIKLTIAGENLDAEVPLSYKYLNATRGDILQPLRIVPNLGAIANNPILYFDKVKAANISVKLQPFMDMATTNVTLKSDGQDIGMLIVNNLKSGVDTTVNVPVITAMMTGSQSRPIEIHLTDQKNSVGQRIISYDHIPELAFYEPAEVKAVPITWKATTGKIGYVDGAGDYVLQQLQNLGLDAEVLPASALADPKSLKKYKAIVIGVRAFNTNTTLAENAKNLWQYAENGGNVIVQYNTNARLITNDIGPYPIQLSRLRTTEEDAAMTVLDAESPLMNIPNKIEQKDFDNWVQERGLYYADIFDPKYKTLFSMHDTDEQPTNSAVLYTPYGKGNYIYTGLSFFRQLPAGNAGAIKLFLNMINMPTR